MDIPLSGIKGIGPTRLKALNAQDIHTTRDLLMCLPINYRDLSRITPLDDLRAGDIAAVKVRVDGTVIDYRTKNILISKVWVTDDSGSITVVWYNQPWMKKNVRMGQELLLYGRVERRGPELTLNSPSIEREEALIPVYRQIENIPQRTFRQLIRIALDQDEGHWPDDLPESLRLKYGLCERSVAIRAAHFPKSREQLQIARRRLSFEELLLYQAGLWMMRGTGQKGVQIPCGKQDADEFWETLPFPPTAAQKRVLLEILNDMNNPLAMARLVQGDVGSGKTALAFGALYVAAKNGYMGAMMAPTEILAQQHYESAQSALEPLGIRCGLLTGSMTVKQKREAHKAIAAGEWRVVIGTHALISKGVEYQNLGLVVTDEQHRFGVKQRKLLGEKGDSPNVLVMSATPIPRTLALILYGDLDISILDELPPGRTPVKTRIVPEPKRDAMYQFIVAEVRQGRQAYVVCPLVEESETIDAAPAEVIYEQLRDEALKEVRVGLVHGRMKPIDKESTLTAFHKRELDVLVSTTVIEVGVNVPNASVMVIENAERFGLAQLHQLRGRVGRGAAISWCFLMAESNERLDLMTKTNDGFIIAQKDMELRGAGELLGLRQSGEMTAGVGALMSDTALLQETHDALKLLMTAPDSEETQQVLRAAKIAFDAHMKDIAMN